MPETTTEPGELAYLGVTCDEPPYCDDALAADFKVRVADDRATRLGYVLDYAERQGWLIVGRADPETAKSYCVLHAAERRP